MLRVLIKPLFGDLSPLLIREKVKIEVIEVDNTIVKEKEVIKRIGENYSDIDKELLAFCIESGKISCSVKSENDWRYWQRKREQLNELEQKLKNDKLINK